MNNTSPLEQLAAFAICFVAGALSVMALAAYANVLRGKPSPLNASGSDQFDTQRGSREAVPPGGSNLP